MMLAACCGGLGLAPAPVIEAGGRSVRILALELIQGHERYMTQVRGAGEAEWSTAALWHTSGTAWLLDDSPIELGTPDSLYADVMAMCSPEVRSDRGGLGAEVPHWPAEIVSSLERRGIHGSGTVAFCPEHFLSVIASSPMDTAVLLPHAETRLGVAGLRRAGGICRRAAAAFERCGVKAAATTVAKTTFDEFGRRTTSTAASANAAFLATMQAAARADERAWSRAAGVGRLVGEFDSGALAHRLSSRTASPLALALTTRPRPRPHAPARPSPGELAQLGDSVLDGLEAATGRGHITVRGLPSQCPPLPALGTTPAVTAELLRSHCGASVDPVWSQCGAIVEPR